MCLKLCSKLLNEDIEKDGGHSTEAPGWKSNLQRHQHSLKIKSKMGLVCFRSSEITIQRKEGFVNTQPAFYSRIRSVKCPHKLRMSNMYLNNLNMTSSCDSISGEILRCTWRDIRTISASVAFIKNLQPPCSNQFQGFFQLSKYVAKSLFFFHISKKLFLYSSR